MLSYSGLEAYQLPQEKHTRKQLTSGAVKEGRSQVELLAAVFHVHVHLRLLSRGSSVEVRLDTGAEGLPRKNGRGYPIQGMAAIRLQNLSSADPFECPPEIKGCLGEQGHVSKTAL